MAARLGRCSTGEGVRAAEEITERVDEGLEQLG